MWVYAKPVRAAVESQPEGVCSKSFIIYKKSLYMPKTPVKS